MFIKNLKIKNIRCIKDLELKPILSLDINNYDEEIKVEEIKLNYLSNINE